MLSSNKALRCHNIEIAKTIMEDTNNPFDIRDIYVLDIFSAVRSMSILSMIYFLLVDIEKGVALMDMRSLIT